MQKSFKFFVIALAIMVVVPQIAFAAWWNPFTWGWLNSIFHFQQTQQQKKIENPKNNSDQTASWKTYDRGDGFSFKYPISWVVSTKPTDTGATISVWSSEAKAQSADSSQNAGMPPIYPEFSLNYQSLDSFKQFAKGLIGKDVTGVKDFVSSYGYFASYAGTNVGGQKAYAVISVANRATYVVYVEIGNRVYVLGTEDFSKGSYDPKNPQIDENVKKIISTFKFTTPTKPTIKVNSPNGGEKFYADSPITVSWFENYASKTAKVLLCSKLAGCVYTSPQINAVAGQNTFTVPAGINNKICSGTTGNLNCYLDVGYKIKVMTDAPQGIAGEFFSDESDNYFTITEATLTAGWKTYKSSVYDYEIKLPQGFEMAPVNVPTALPVEMAKYSDNDHDFNLEIYARNNDFVLNSCLKDLNGNDIKATKDINGNKFYIYEERKIGTGERMSLAQGAMQSEYHILHGGSCYIVQYTIAHLSNQIPSISKTQEQFGLLEQIFSTFKFTK